MPSRSNRIRARRALSGPSSDPGADSLSDSDSAPPSEPTIMAKPSKNNKTVPKTSTKRQRTSDKERNAEPSRLKRLLALLLSTTILLTLYHVFRLYTKGQGILGVPVPSIPANSMAAGGGEGRGMVAQLSPPPDNSDLKLEDLDLDTLQAAFDALYGDGGPLGPDAGSGSGNRRSDGSGEYRVAQRRKESLK